MSYSQNELKYSYESLEPYIDAKTMEIHYSKHHAGYVAKLNASLDGHTIESNTIENLISAIDTLPESVRVSVRNNGGGHANHSLFWEILSPNSGGNPTGELGNAINATFGNYESFKNEFSNAAATRFGSGWAWLCVKKDSTLIICSTANQDNPLMKGLLDEPATPILGLDVWEHAYYLKYQNKRPDYINAFFNIINWNVVAEKYQAAL